MKRALCCGLCATVLVSVSGCLSPMGRAEDWRGRLSVGMARNDVLEAVGPPDTSRSDDTGVMWTYRFESGWGVGYWTIQVLVILLIVPLVIAARSSGGGSLMLGSTAEFRLHITPEGRVEWVGPVELPN